MIQTTYKYIMTHKHVPSDKCLYITSCIECIDMLNKLHQIIQFRNSIMCLNRIGIYNKYKFGIDYVHEIPNYSTRCLKKTNLNPIKFIECINRVQCLKHYCQKVPKSIKISNGLIFQVRFCIFPLSVSSLFFLLFK